MMNISTLRPGLLVSLKTSMQGNVAYSRKDIVTDTVREDGTMMAQWETEKVVTNPAELDRASKVRSKARSLIRAICSQSTFGLLCPETDREKLDDATAQARLLAEEFNREATDTQIGVFVLVGRVAADDVEAVRAINSEIRDLLTSMEMGLKRLDVAAVREAATRAKDLSAMLSPVAAERAQKAIEVARKAAREIVKAGEVGSIAVDEATLNAIRTSRTAFLDLDEQVQEEVQAPAVVGRAIDLDPATAPAPVVAHTVPQMEL